MMLKTLEKSGKTEEAAIAAALEELGLDRDDVSVEIVERAKSGFLGIGASPAVIRVQYEAPDEEAEQEAAPAEAQAYLNELVDGYLLGMSQPLLLLPESGGAWLKACYDAEKDVILMDEETQQKARSKFLQTYEGNMVVSGEGADIWYQRLWRSLEPAHYEEIIAQTQRYLLPLYRYHRSTQI